MVSEYCLCNYVVAADSPLWVKNDSRTRGKTGVHVLTARNTDLTPWRIL